MNPRSHYLSFRRLSIGRKLTLAIMLTVVTALLLMSAGLAAYERATTRRYVVDHVALIGRLFAAETGPAFARRDRAAVEEVLQGIQQMPHVDAACVLDPQGRVFAAVRKSTFTRPWPKLSVVSHDLRDDGIDMSRAIRVDGRTIGALYVHSSNYGIQQRTRAYVAFAVLTLVFAITCAALVALWLQRIVAAPIIRLARVARSVGQNRDWGTRATKANDDEIGSLVDAFNGMLATIQDREAELSRANATLEVRVGERTAALQHANSLLAATVEATNDAIVAIDRSCRIICYNSKFRDLWSVPAGLLEAGDFRAVAPVLAAQMQDPERYLSQVRRIHEDPTAIVDDTVELKDGRVFERHVQPQWVDGRIAGVVSSTRDVTSQVRTEEALRRAKARAEEAVRTKSEFLANMSHEIRTPMSGVIGMAALLLETPLAAEQREYATTIRDSAEILLTIINDILDFSKIEAGKLRFEERDFDLRAVVDAAVDLFAVRAGVKGLELTTAEFADDVVDRVRGDAGRLRQVLVNLLGNAVKFTERGAVNVTVATERDLGSEVVLKFQVRDTGIGIAAPARERLFQAFTQADSSMSRKYGGTGLGLAISRQLCGLMRGEMGVESEPGHGSTFWFTVRLPKANPAVPPQQEPLPRGMRVLVVEDHAGQRAAVMAAIRAWQVQVDGAPDPTTALARMRSAAAAGRAFDWVLIDERMPGGDGMAFAREISRDPAATPTRLLLMKATGHAFPPERLAAAGFAAQLRKPLNRGRLRALLAGAAVSPAGAEPGLAATVTAARTTPPARPPHDPALHILLAEDNPVNQRVARALLERAGHVITTVGTGSDAVQAVEEGGFDVVLMDCQMPEMDGYQAAREIRRLERETAVPWPSPLPIIALTANAMADDREKCLAAGMDDYVSKPIRGDTLTDALARVRRTSHRRNPGDREVHR